MNRDEVPNIGQPIEVILKSIRSADSFTIESVVMLQKDMADAMCDVAVVLDVYPGYINVKRLNEWTTLKSKALARLREIATRRPDAPPEKVNV